MKTPTLGGEDLTLTDRTKYLGVMFDQKLTWSLHLEYVISRARSALFLSSKMVGSTWGLKPKIMDWLYKSIVRPMISYAALIWWPKLSHKNSELALTKLQRTACLAITGACRSCPTAAMEVLLNLTPLPIFIESEAARWAYRIKASHNLKPGDLTGHLSILQKCEAPEVTCTDYMATRFHFSKNYSISFIDRET